LKHILTVEQFLSCTELLSIFQLLLLFFEITMIKVLMKRLSSLILRVVHLSTSEAGYRFQVGLVYEFVISLRLSLLLMINFLVDNGFLNILFELLSLLLDIKLKLGIIVPLLILTPALDRIY
jgi:hypothetical protein